ncbi:MAG: formate--tetrahydrofolate ligase [Clostridia bacterium]
MHKSQTWFRLRTYSAIIHGGPFANIAQGCNILLLQNAMKLADYTITEAGLDRLRCREILDINVECRHKRPVVSCVATIRALKYHGDKEEIKKKILKH